MKAGKQEMMGLACPKRYMHGLVYQSLEAGAGGITTGSQLKTTVLKQDPLKAVGLTPTNTPQGAQGILCMARTLAENFVCEDNGLGG